jgi:hypothetical protein
MWSTSLGRRYRGDYRNEMREARYCANGTFDANRRGGGAAHAFCACSK